MAAEMCEGDGVRGYSLLVRTVPFTIFTAGLGTGDEGFAVDGSLPSKVQVWIPASKKHTSFMLRCCKEIRGRLKHFFINKAANF